MAKDPPHELGRADLPVGLDGRCTPKAFGAGRVPTVLKGASASACRGILSRQPMKVLLTGANGFVGSHILDVSARAASPRPSCSDPPATSASSKRICRAWTCASVPSAIRPAWPPPCRASPTSSIAPAAPRRCAWRNSTRSIKPARATSSRRSTSNGRIQRLVHLSSLAAGGPSLPGHRRVKTPRPTPSPNTARASSPAKRPCAAPASRPHVILRPPAVYGPRDDAFLTLFKTVKAHLRPHLGRRRHALSLVFVKDLAEAVVTCLTHPAAVGKTFYVASPEVSSAHGWRTKSPDK